MVDRYTRVVLTVIAVALVWLCLWGPGPPMFGTPAEARTKSAPAKVTAPTGPVQVRVTNWSEAELWLSKPVQEVEGTVHVEGPVEVTGTVEVDEPVEVTGSVDVGDAVDVRQPAPLKVQVVGPVGVVNGSWWPFGGGALRVALDGPVKVEGQPFGTPVPVTGGTAASDPLEVDIVRVGGRRLQVSYLTSFEGFSAVKGVPVDIRGIER